jgi:Tfp pilus assembly protein PilF
MRIRSFAAVLIAVGLAATSVVAPAQKKDDKAPKPPQVSRAVVKPIIAAQDASKKEQWGECIAKLREVQAIPNLTPYDNYVLNDLLGFCALRAGDNALTLQAWAQVLDSEYSDAGRSASLRKGLLQLSYQAKDYAKAVDYGKRLITDGGADESVYLLTIQSYYLQNDFKTAETMSVEYIQSLEQKGQTPPDMALQLYSSSCIKQEDDACTLKALEKQAQYFPKKETWPNLTLLMFRSGGEANTLNIFRLSREMGGMIRGEEFTEMAQLSIEKGLPGEAQATIEEGQAKGVFSNNKTTQELANRLLSTAKAQALADKPTLIKQDVEAASRKNGEVDARIALAFLSYGDFEKAVVAFERGLAKGNVRNPVETQLNLGIAQLKAGKKEAAAATFAAIKGDETLQRLARLWSLKTR